MGIWRAIAKRSNTAPYQRRAHDDRLDQSGSDVLVNAAAGKGWPPDRRQGPAAATAKLRQTTGGSGGGVQRCDERASHRGDVRLIIDLWWSNTDWLRTALSLIEAIVHFPTIFFLLGVLYWSDRRVNRWQATTAVARTQLHPLVTSHRHRRGDAENKPPPFLHFRSPARRS